MKTNEELNLEMFGTLQLQKIKSRWYASDENLKGLNIVGVGTTQVNAAMELVKKLIKIDFEIQKTLQNIDEVADNLKEK